MMKCVSWPQLRDEIDRSSNVVSIGGQHAEGWSGKAGYVALFAISVRTLMIRIPTASSIPKWYSITVLR